MGLCLLLLAAYFIVAHYVQDYSDPVGFVNRAFNWSEAGDAADRAPLYPIILFAIMQLVGRDWVYLANLPFLLVTLFLLARLTARAWEDGHPERKGGSYGVLAGLTACVVLFVVRRGFLLQLINPFREPLTFLGMLLSVLLCWQGWRTRRTWVLLVAGLVLGITTSIRETALLVALPMGLWLLGEMVVERKVRWGSIAFLGLGIGLGLVPLLHKNYAYSGRALVPAYSAAQVERYEETGSWDIPIPGMSLRHFPRIAPVTLAYTRNAYGSFGILAFLVGIGYAIQRRNRSVLLLVLPSWFLYFIFYSFYLRYMVRYVLAGELFFGMILAYGVACGAETLGGWLSRRKPKAECAMQWAWAGGLLLWVLITILPWMTRPNNRTKVWHLAPLRAELLEHIETPATFMGGRHFCYRLAWLLDQDFYEYTLHFQWDLQTYASLEERLALQGADTLRRFSSGNYYIDGSPFWLAANWLERTPVFDFSQLSVPFERYGRRLEGPLYRVHPWQETRMALRRNKPRPERALIMLDLKRPWDYPGRRHLTGSETGGEQRHSLSNGVQFVELEPRASSPAFEFILESDQPLPPEPFWKLIGLNEEILIEYGAAATHWAWNLAGTELYAGHTIPHACAYLYDRGEILLPSFADSDHDVYAEIRVEFVQDHPHWRQQRHRLKIHTEADEVEHPLPPRRHQARRVVKLGAGADRLEWVPVQLETTLPGYQVQISQEFSSRVKQHGFVKLYDVRVFSVSRRVELPLNLDLGGSLDFLLPLEGFYGRERAGAKRARWTEGNASIQVRIPRDVDALRVIWRTLRVEGITDERVDQPVFFVDEVRFPHGSYDVVEDDVTITYQFDIDVGSLAAGEWTVLGVESPTFNPARDWGTTDTRDLGLFVERVEVIRRE